MTYNVHSCIGNDAVLSVERIADVIRESSPDIVCLQELDVGRARTGTVDQARSIAELLGMEFCFHPAVKIATEHYGDAILSRHPLTTMHTGALPGLSARPGMERRGALWVMIRAGGVPVQVLNTHLGLSAKERLAQCHALIGTDWLGHPECVGPVILCGDMNAIPASGVYRQFRGRLRDAQRSLRHHWPKATFPSRFPVVRIDHIFINDFFDVQAVQVPKTPLARIASDHLPLVVELTFQTPERDQP